MPGRILVDLRPLRESREFRLLFVGQVVSTFGAILTVVAIPYQLFHQTHSTFQVGAISLVQLGPLIAGSLVGGSVADAVDRRRLLVWATVALLVCSGLLAVNAVAARPSLLVLYLVSALGAGLTGFASTARNAVVPVLVRTAALAGGFALIQIIFQVGNVAGPALAGPIIGVLGLPWAYGIDAVTYLAALVSLFLMRPIPPEPGHRPVRGSFREGRSYLRGRPVIQGIYLIDINAMVFGMPRAVFPALSTRFATGLSSATVLGFLYAALGVGGLLGALTTGWVGAVRRQGWAITLAVVAWGAAITLFGFSTVLWLSLTLLVLASWADVISAVLRNTMLQTSIPPRFRGRMTAIQMAVVQGGPRLGDMETGVATALVGLEPAVVSGGLLCILGAGVLSALLPAFRRQRVGDPVHDPDGPVHDPDGPAEGAG